MQTDLTPRKHRRQMTLAEIAAIENFVHSLDRGLWIANGHAINRSGERICSDSQLLDVFRFGLVIEVRPDSRILFRADELCVVANIVSRKVCTVWRNSFDDNHSTLRLQNYQWRGSIIELVEQLKRRKQNA